MLVADLEEFKTVVALAEQAHRKYGVSESVYQDIADPRSLTVVINGKKDDIESWLNSPERAELASSLKVDASGGRWMAEVLFPEGVYRITS